MKTPSDHELRQRLEASSVKVPESGCWIWLGAIDKDGYGQSWWKRKNMRSHRLSWLLHRGPLVSGLVIMHSCDVTSCINPNHLEQVAQAVNNTDKMEKGRHRVASGNSHYMKSRPRNGEQCRQSRLSEVDVKSIRQRFNEGEMQELLATEFGVTRTCISAVVTRRTWKHI